MQNSKTYMVQPEKYARSSYSVSIVFVSGTRSPHPHGNVTGVGAEMLLLPVVGGAGSAGWVLGH